MQIRERTENGWRMVTLEPRTLTRDIQATTIHGKTHQEIVDTTLEAGETIYIKPGTFDGPPAFWQPGDPPARVVIYDGDGMAQRIFYDDHDALAKID